MRLWICKKRCESLKVDENECEKICEIQEEECGGFYSRGHNRTNAPTSSLMLSFPFLVSGVVATEAGCGGVWRFFPYPEAGDAQLTGHKTRQATHTRRPCFSFYVYFMFIFYFVGMAATERSEKRIDTRVTLPIRWCCTTGKSKD